MGVRAMCLTVFVAVAVAMSICVAGEIHRVGGSSGWTSTNLSTNPIFYKSWAASKLFQLGDTILFEYNKEFHNVVRVTHKNFNACNLTAPYSTWVTGNDTFPITKPGHYYFVCGFRGHCLAGQKVDIRVLRSTPGGPPSPDKPHPPKKNAASSTLSYFNLWFHGVVTFAIANALF